MMDTPRRGENGSRGERRKEGRKEDEKERGEEDGVEEEDEGGRGDILGQRSRAETF